MNRRAALMMHQGDYLRPNRIDCTEWNGVGQGARVRRSGRRIVTMCAGIQGTW